MDRTRWLGVKWGLLGASLAVCALAYGHALPIAWGMAASCLIPLIWAVDAYLAQRRAMFAAAAALVLITALPLLHLAG